MSFFGEETMTVAFPNLFQDQGLQSIDHQVDQSHSEPFSLLQTLMYPAECDSGGTEG
jgi:hypothetical protein